MRVVNINIITFIIITIYTYDCYIIIGTYYTCITYEVSDLDTPPHPSPLHHTFKTPPAPQRFSGI